MAACVHCWELELLRVTRRGCAALVGHQLSTSLQRGRSAQMIEWPSAMENCLQPCEGGLVGSKCGGHPGGASFAGVAASATRLTRCSIAQQRAARSE